MEQLARRANILDPIHDILAPTVWDDPGAPRPHLKDAHRKWIMREVYTHASHFEPNADAWLTLVLTGSLTTYQYSDTSDCDVSLFIDPFKLPEWDRAKLIGLMIEHMDGTKLPGTPFEMQCFVVAKNISTADLYQPGLRSGYDIKRQTWIVPPDKSRTHDVQREQNADYVYALESADKMERLLRYETDKAVQYWHQIHKRRMRDQRAGKGDFSQANIVYKFLANRGLFPEISQASGEYIAKFIEGKSRVLFNNFRPEMNHPQGPTGAELPFVYDPNDDLVHLGPPNSYHVELIHRTPELRTQYPGDLATAPFLENKDHVHGRMTWPAKETIFYGNPDPTHMESINAGLGATTKEVEGQTWKDLDDFKFSEPSGTA
jgi:hypothetical protein